MEVSGRLTALTHVLCSSPVCVALEILNNERHIVILTEKALHHWTNHLNIGEIYSITGLTPTSLKLKDKTFRVLRASSSSTYYHRKEVSFPSIQSNGPLSPNANISGIITDINRLIGLVTLNNQVEVFISYQLPLSEVPPLYKGQKVSFYNIHKVSDNANNSIYVMCSRGFVFRHTPGEGQTFISRYVDCPLISTAIKQGMGFMDLLWLHEQAKVVCSAFPVDFLKQFYKSGDIAGNVRMETIRKLAEQSLLSEQGSVHRSSLIEFLEVDNHTCLPMKNSCVREASHSLIPQTFSSHTKPQKVSSHSIMKEKSKGELEIYFYSQPIIGILTPADDEIIFRLIDNCSELRVMVTNNKQLVQSREIKELHNCMVVISKFLGVYHRYCHDCPSKVLYLNAVHIEADVQNISKIQ